MKRKSTNRPVFSHLDEQGGARMVDVGHKPVQSRRAVAAGTLRCQAATLTALRAKALPKGDVLTVAQLAGIQAAKRTADLIPLCHPLALDQIDVRFGIKRDRVEITCTVRTSAKTGVQMEALTGVSVAALALYDMCKAVDHSMRIEGIRLLEKTKQ
jgi:cyclic pyranopterin monophosphate synthase